MTDITLENRLTALEAQHAQTVKERDELRAALTTEKVGRRFERSRLIAEKCALPADIIEARYRNSFKIEGDALVGYDDQGTKIYSRQQPGQVADFDEALEILINQRPQDAAAIFKPPGSVAGSPGGDRRRAQVLTRAAFNALSPVERKAHFKAGGALVD
jgi:hypothetical protein